MGRLAAWISILLLAMYLIFVGGAWLGLYETWLRLVSTLLVAIAGTVWIGVARTRPEWRPKSALLPAIVAALGSLALSTVVSRHPRQSVEYLGYAILLAALYLLLVRLIASPFFRARFATLAVACAFVLGGAFALLNLLHWVSWWEVVGKITVPPLRPESESLTYGNPSAAMTVIVLFACSAGAIVGASSRARRVLVVGLAALSVFAMIVSGSRSGWFASGIATVTIIGLYAIAPLRRHQARDQLAAWMDEARARVLLGLAVVGGLGVFAILAPALLQRATEGGVELRASYVLAAQRMFGEAPILGVGPGSWAIEHTRYTLASEGLIYVPHAHNIYAQAAAELGAVGILAGIVLFACLALLVRDGMRDPDLGRRRWGWAAAFALIYFAAHQLLDSYANMPAILFAAALPVAWLDATTTKPISVARRAMPARLGRVPAAAGLMLLTSAAAGLIATELPALSEATAVKLANEGRWTLADEKARQAVAIDPGWAPYAFTMGLTAANVGDHVRAAEMFRAVAESDDIPEAWLDLAAEEAIIGDVNAARDALGHAVRLGLQRTGLAMAIGDLAARVGEPVLSDRAFFVAIAAVPSLAGDPWWRTTPARFAQLSRVVDALVADADPGIRWQIALMAGDAARARELLPATSSAAGSLEPLDIIDAWTGDESAFARVVAACDANPLGADAVLWAARLEGLRGNVDAQNRYLRWASTVGSDSFGTEIRVSDRPMLGRSAQGGVGEFWGTYTYRRPTPWNLLVPSLVQLTVE